MNSTPRLMNLKGVALSTETVRGEVILELPNRMVTTNLDDTRPDFAAHMQAHVYCQRKAHLAPIEIIQLPAGTRLFGGGHFVVEVAGSFLEEQFPPYIGSLVRDLSDITGISRPVDAIHGEVLIVGRFGVSTWGHWIGELLPKMVLAEQAYPGRFRYALPRHVTDPAQTHSVWSSIRESIVACGIDLSRVLPVDDDKDYRFTGLWGMTSLWSDHMIHPAASAILRRATSHIAPNGPSKLAVIRDDRYRRKIANADEIYALLAQHGFQSEATGLLSFVEQVARFKALEQVFSVLGSDLTNLIFATDGVRVISAAPDVFGDRFFYALVLDREGAMADLRGSTGKTDAVEHKSAFTLDAGILDQAIEAMSDAKAP